jgi:hypothetical protein
MAKATRVDVIFLAIHEVLTGLLTGFGGILLTAFLQSLVEPSTGLFEAVLYPCLMGLLGLLGGIVVVGYQYLRQRERGQLITRQLLQAIVGILGGVATSWGVMLLFRNSLPLKGPVILTIMVLPLAGLLIGFNHRMRHA